MERRHHHHPTGRKENRAQSSLCEKKKEKSSYPGFYIYIFANPLLQLLTADGSIDKRFSSTRKEDEEEEVIIPLGQKASKGKCQPLFECIYPHDRQGQREESGFVCAIRLIWEKEEEKKEKERKKKLLIGQPAVIYSCACLHTHNMTRICNDQK